MSNFNMFLIGAKFPVTVYQGQRWFDGEVAGQEFWDGFDLWSDADGNEFEAHFVGWGSSPETETKSYSSIGELVSLIKKRTIDSEGVASDEMFLTENPRVIGGLDENGKLIFVTQKNGSQICQFISDDWASYMEDN